MPSTSITGRGRDHATAGSQTHLDRLGLWLPRRGADRFAAWAIAALAFLAFSNSLWNGFAMDDIVIILDNPAIRHLSNPRAIFGAGYWPENSNLLYRPLVIFSYALNYAMGGLRPLPYHLVNVLLHAGNSALIYCLLVALFRVRGLAFAAAAAFALHPIHTEAVANIVGRAELLANVFLLLSWWWYLKLDEAPERAERRWLAASVAAFTLALFCKEHAVVLVGLLTLTDLLRASEKGLSIGRTIWEKCWTAYVWYLPPLAMYLVVRFLVLGGLLGSRPSFLANPLVEADSWTRFLTAIKVLGRYLWLLLAPVRLSSDYFYNQVPLSRSPADPAVLAALLALLGLLALAVWSWRRRPVITAGVAIPAMAISPVSNLPFLIGTMMAERVLYLPSVGFCLLLAAGVTALAARPRWGLLAVGAFGLLLLGYGARTVVRNRDWRSNATIFSAAVRTSPNSAVAHVYLGHVLLDHGDIPGARREFERSLEIYPNYSKALSYLGMVLEGQGQIDEAIRAYQKIDKDKKYYGRAHLKLGFIALQQGRRPDALMEFREAARSPLLEPLDSNQVAEGFFQLGSFAEAQAVLEAARSSSPDIYFIRRNLALVYSRQERWEDALREMEAAAQLRPESPEIQLELGRLYTQRGLLAPAETAINASLRLRPNDPDALNLFGAVLLQQGRLKEATEALQGALRLRPEDAEVHYTLGIVLAKLGKLTDAQEQFEASLRVRPLYPSAHLALGKVLQAQGKSAEARRELQIADSPERSRPSDAAKK